MSENNYKILLVEDDPDLQELLKLHIDAEGFVVFTALNGSQALDFLNESGQEIDLIVSDIVMDEIDGYEFCKRVHESEQLKGIPFIFMSVLSSLDEKLKGFEVGADDYITKPVDPSLLIQKIIKVISIREKNAELAEMLTQSQSVAMQAMTYSSDLGNVIEFFKNSISSKTFEDLAKLFFSFMQNQGLRSSIQFFTPKGAVNFGDRGDISPLEANVIELSRQKSRFFDFGNRTIINYKDFSILIKNMPIDDAERYGILKDTIGTLCNAIEARTNTILMDKKNEDRAGLVEAINTMMVETRKTIEDIQQENASAISTMMNDIDDTMMTLGLTEEQENDIRGIVTQAMKQVDEVFGRSIIIERQFDTIQDKLNSIFSRK